MNYGICAKGLFGSQGFYYASEYKDPDISLQSRWIMGYVQKVYLDLKDFTMQLSMRAQILVCNQDKI